MVRAGGAWGCCHPGHPCLNKCRLLYFQKCPEAEFTHKHRHTHTHTPLNVRTKKRTIHNMHCQHKDTPLARRGGEDFALEATPLWLCPCPPLVTSLTFVL